MEEKINIVICLGSSCFSRGNSKTLEIVKQYLLENDLTDKTDFRGSLCSNNCNHGPVLKINGEVYHEVNENNVTHILDTVFNNEKEEEHPLIHLA